MTTPPAHLQVSRTRTYAISAPLVGRLRLRDLRHLVEATAHEPDEDAYLFTRCNHTPEEALKVLRVIVKDRQGEEGSDE